jgi:hypothetical protein
MAAMTFLEAFSMSLGLGKTKAAILRLARFSRICTETP